MAAKKRTKRRGERKVDRGLNLTHKNMSPQEQVTFGRKYLAGLDPSVRAQVLGQPPQSSTSPQDPAGAFAAGVQGEPAFEPRGGDRHAAERQRLAQDAARHGLQVPIDMQPSDSSRFASAEETKRRRAAEAKREPSKKQLAAERRYQQRRREAGLPPSGCGGSPVLPGSGGSFVG